MKKQSFYTLWLRIDGQELVRLIEDEPTFQIRFLAFKRAKELLEENYYSHCTLIVRKITEGTRKCTQWELRK